MMCITIIYNYISIAFEHNVYDNIIIKVKIRLYSRSRTWECVIQYHCVRHQQTQTY